MALAVPLALLATYGLLRLSTTAFTELRARYPKLRLFLSTTTLTGRMLEAGGYRVLVGGNIGQALSAMGWRRYAQHFTNARIEAGFLNAINGLL